VTQMNDVTQSQPLVYAGQPGYKSMVQFQVRTEKNGEFEVLHLCKIDVVKLYSAETGEEIAVEWRGSRIKAKSDMASGTECYGFALGDTLERALYLQALETKKSEAEPPKKSV